MIACGAIAVCGVAILLSKSRGTILPALALPAILMCVQRGWSRVLSIVVLVLVVVVGLPRALESDVARSVLRVDTRGDDITSGRRFVWKENMRMILNDPWTGVNHASYDKDYALVTEISRDGVTEVVALTPHNIVISYLVHYGVLLGTAIVLATLYALWRSYRRSFALSEKALTMIAMGAFIIHLSVDMWGLLYLWSLVLFTAPTVAAMEGGLRVE